MAASTKTFVNSSTPQCEDDDLNGFILENNNLIEGSGQALNTSDNQQTHKAAAVYAAGGDFYTDSGGATAYVLSVVGAKVAPPVYFDGMRVRFKANTTNSGAATINVDGLGVVNLFANGAALPANSVIVGKFIEAVYDTARFNVFNGLNVAADATISANWIFTGTANVFNGINQANLLDKTATETVSGAYTFTNASNVYNGIAQANLLSKIAAETVTGAYDYTNAAGLKVSGVKLRDSGDEYTEDGTTASVAGSGGSVITTITHSLGTDEIDWFIKIKPSSSGNWEGNVIDFNGEYTRLLGAAITTLVGVNAVAGATGTLKLILYNRDSSAQTFDYTVIVRKRTV